MQNGYRIRCANNKETSLKQVRELVMGSVLALFTAAVAAHPALPKLQWLGQSAFRITTPSVKVMVMDPWLKANPLAKGMPRQFLSFMKDSGIEVHVLKPGETFTTTKRRQP